MRRLVGFIRVAEILKSEGFKFESLLNGVVTYRYSDRRVEFSTKSVKESGWTFDELIDLIDGIKNTPMSRGRLIADRWNTMVTTGRNRKLRLIVGGKK